MFNCLPWFSRLMNRYRYDGIDPSVCVAEVDDDLVVD